MSWRYLQFDVVEFLPNIRAHAYIIVACQSDRPYDDAIDMEEIHSFAAK